MAALEVLARDALLPFLDQARTQIAIGMFDQEAVHCDRHEEDMIRVGKNE